MALDTLRQIIDSYDPNAPLAEAWTIPAPWYVAPRIADLELRTVFARSWQLAGRVDQLQKPGQYITCKIAGEPIVVVRGFESRRRRTDGSRQRAVGRKQRPRA